MIDDGVLFRFGPCVRRLAIVETGRRHSGLGIYRPMHFVSVDKLKTQAINFIAKTRLVRWQAWCLREWEMNGKILQTKREIQGRREKSWSNHDAKVNSETKQIVLRRRTCIVWPETLKFQAWRDQNSKLAAVLSIFRLCQETGDPQSTVQLETRFRRTRNPFLFD